MEKNDRSRRDFVKRLAYVTPVVLTLQASPSTAQVGSGGPRRTQLPPPMPAERAPGD